MAIINHTLNIINHKSRLMNLELSTRTLGDWLEHWAEVTPDKEYIV